MISKQQLQQWQKQNAKDIQQYKKDEESLKKMTDTSQQGIRLFFERMRAKYLNFNDEQHDKLNRLICYTEINKQLENYPRILSVYLTYNTASILIFAVGVLAPKKIISKIIISLLFFGLKTNIGNGLMTYYTVQKMALSDNMREKQQELRYILEFYYKHKKFTNDIMTQQQQKNAQALMAQIKKLNQKYYNYKKIESLL